MKHSKAAAATLGSADCLPVMAETYPMFGKRLRVTCTVGRQPHHKRTWLEWCALQTQGRVMNQFLDSQEASFPFLLCFSRC